VVNKTQQPQDYDENSIKILNGLEPVQKRPGMYTRTDSPNHIVQEVVDNAQDEALAGFATEIYIKMNTDGSVTVKDNGRGIPTAIHPVAKISTVEVVYTKLHAGGKFDNGSSKAYKFTGGLHGVGVSVTNALSKRLEVVVYREGYKHFMAFEHGLVVEPLTKEKLPRGETKKTGTEVTFWPDGKYFDSPTVHLAEMENYLKAKAVLLPNAQLTFEKPNKDPIQWQYPNGISQYLEEEVGDQGEWVVPVFNCEAYHQEDNGSFEEGEGFSLSLGWLSEGRTTSRSYVNLIPTISGGRHETGLKAGLLEAIRNFGERNNYIPKGVKIESEDVWSRLCFVISVKLAEPQFQGQTKDRLTSEKAHRLVQALIRDNVELWLNDHYEDGRKIVELIVEEAVSRSKSATKMERKKGSGATVLPGKLADCISKIVESTELFLVEGDSAGGSAKQARDREYQAIMPLKGKPSNTWEIPHDDILTTDTVGDISIAIGIDPHDPKDADNVDLSKLRYFKIVIMADADVDGLHIQVLLLALFYKHFYALIKNGHIYIAQSPLYKIDAPAKKRGGEKRKLYALDEIELNNFQQDLIKEGLTPDKWSVSRFKGLGEMNPEQLSETTMNPDSRRLLKIEGEDIADMDSVFNLLLGSKNSKQRQVWMAEFGNTVEYDI